MLVDYRDTTFEHCRIGLRGKPIGHRLQIVRQHDVIGTHDHDDRGRHHPQAFAVVAVGTEILLVFLIVHTLITVRDLTHVARRFRIRVAVVNNNKPKILVGLRQNRVDSLFEVVYVAVVRQHYVDRHCGGESLS